MTSLRSIRKQTEKKIIEAGYKEGELQISQDALIFMRDYLNSNLNALIIKTIQEIISHNNEHNYKIKKRFTKDAVKKALFETYARTLQNDEIRTPELSKMMRLENDMPQGIPKPQNLGER